MSEEKQPEWTSFKSGKSETEPDANDVSYAEASKYQEGEFGPIPSMDKSSARAARLNSREGYSPTESDKPLFGGALATSLDVTQGQLDEIYSIMGELNLAAFGNQRRIETVALGVITVVVNYDRFHRRKNPDAQRIAESRPFRELMMEHDIDYSDLGTAKRIVKQELNKRGYY